MDARLQVRLLGAPEASLDGQRVTDLKLRKTQALLYLLASQGGPQPRSILTGLLWCELPEAAASANLRKSLFELRRALGDFLDVERETVALRRGDAVWVDRSEFVARADVPGARDVGQLEEAVSLYRGDFLAGFHVHDAPEFEHWVAAERTRLRELALASLHTLTVCYCRGRRSGARHRPHPPRPGAGAVARGGALRSHAAAGARRAAQRGVGAVRDLPAGATRGVGRGAGG